MAFGACGFTPAYGPGGSAQRLQGQVLLDEPNTETGYFLTRRIEERLGRAASARYGLALAIKTESEGFGSTSDGRTTRYRLTGTANYALRELSTGRVLTDRSTVAFTGYSASGTNVATLAGERDATERLMVILADQIVDQLVLFATELPA